MRPNKYGAVRTTVDGIVFHSKAEAKRYEYLKILERAGDVRNLELQPAFPVIVNGRKVCTYKADFRYIDVSKEGQCGQVGCVVVEDVKGMKTPVYKLKKKLVEALYPGTVIEEITN